MDSELKPAGPPNALIYGLLKYILEVIFSGRAPNLLVDAAELNICSKIEHIKRSRKGAKVSRVNIKKLSVGKRDCKNYIGTVVAIVGVETVVYLIDITRRDKKWLINEFKSLDECCALRLAD